MLPSVAEIPADSRRQKAAALFDLLANVPNSIAVVEKVLEIWPEHAAYLFTNFQARSPAMMAAAEAAATAARRLMNGREISYAADYRWTCDRLREEELHFHRNGRYRLSSYAAAETEVYSDAQYMARYINGLLLTQVLWFNHVGTLEMFLSRFLAAAEEPFDYLEIGPGHGLMVYFVACAAACRSIEAWDVSEVSISETRAALRQLGVAKPVVLTAVDILKAELPDRAYDRIVISEVLEHLERPEDALRKLRRVIRPNGRLFVNVPINSPSPDHIYLLSNPQDVGELVERAGFSVESMELFATQGKPIEKALKNKISISAGVIARVAPLKS